MIAPNVNRNGVFVQRRKMYVEFPFHNLQSHIPIDWQTPETESPLKTRQTHEQAYLRNIYNQRVNRQITDKYSKPVDTFRAIPNELTLQRDRDALTKELEQFNSSRTVSPNLQGKNEEGLHTYRSQPEMPTASQAQKRLEIQRGTLDLSLNTYNSPNPEAIQYPRYASLQRIQDPYTYEKSFNQGLMNEYRRYANQVPGSSIKELMPDKLQEFLRERTRQNRKNALRASISHAKQPRP